MPNEDLMRCCTRVCLVLLYVGLAHLVDASGSTRNADAGRPISDWYLTFQLQKGWFSYHTYYCKVAHKTSARDSSISASIIDCSSTNIPYTSPFNFLTSQDQEDTALTGQPLSLLSFTDGLCQTQPSRPAPTDDASIHPRHREQQQGGPSTEALPPQPAQKHTDRDGQGAARLAGSHAASDPAVGVLCGPSINAGGTFSLYVPGQEPGRPIPLGTPLHLKEGDRFCTIAATEFSDQALVCDEDNADDAQGLLLFPTAYPFASLTSLYTRGSCGVKSPQEPPVHDVMCLPEQQLSSVESATLPRARSPAHTPDSKQAVTIRDVQKREPRLTFIARNPSQQPLVSGALVSLSIFYPGIVGRFIQTCCATKDPPHLIYCEEAGSIADECWFELQKVKIAGAGRHSLSKSQPLANGDLVSLSAYAAGRYCSTAYDSTLLCASASFSNASRNLFTLTLGQPVSLHTQEN